jgi:hypothetical protein
VHGTLYAADNQPRIYTISHFCPFIISMAATAASDSASGPTEVHFWTPALPYSLFSYALEVRGV